MLNLKNISGLAEAMQQTINADKPINLPSHQADQLESMGLVHFIENQVEPTCQLYREYFREQLTKLNQALSPHFDPIA